MEYDMTDEEAREAVRSGNREINGEVLAGVPTRVVARIVSHDPSYRRHTADGGIVLVSEDGTETTVSTDEYLADHEIGIDEVFYATLDVFLADVKNTTITPTGEVVDALLDLRRIFQKYREDRKKAVGALYRSYLDALGVDR